VAGKKRQRARKLAELIRDSHQSVTLTSEISSPRPTSEARKEGKGKKTEKKSDSST